MIIVCDVLQGNVPVTGKVLVYATFRTFRGFFVVCSKPEMSSTLKKSSSCIRNK